MSVETALDLLPAEVRRVLVLTHLLGLAPAEVAVRVGRPEAAVRRELALGTRALARLLQDDAAARPLPASVGA